MRTIQLELGDELAVKLTPYQNHLAELLELGLRARQERERQARLTERDRLLQLLAASGKVELPTPYTSEPPYTRHTPAPITGQPVSELVIEQRGA